MRSSAAQPQTKQKTCFFAQGRANSELRSVATRAKGEGQPQKKAQNFTFGLQNAYEMRLILIGIRINFCFVFDFKIFSIYFCDGKLYAAVNLSAFGGIVVSNGFAFAKAFIA